MHKTRVQPLSQTTLMRTALLTSLALSVGTGSLDAQTAAGKGWVDGVVVTDTGKVPFSGRYPALGAHVRLMAKDGKYSERIVPHGRVHFLAQRGRPGKSRFDHARFTA